MLYYVLCFCNIKVEKDQGIKSILINCYTGRPEKKEGNSQIKEVWSRGGKTGSGAGGGPRQGGDSRSHDGCSVWQEWQATQRTGSVYEKQNRQHTECYCWVKTFTL